MDRPSAVIIDTDCSLGQAGAKVDDGFALALALASPELDVALVTATPGNVDLLTATGRTLALLERLGRPDIPVAPGGCPDGAVGARAIASRALADPGATTIVALAPLTTVACALGVRAGVATAVREVVVMGGRFGPPGAGPPEFNSRHDPWALRSVLESGARVRLVGIDLTERMALTTAEIDRLDGGGRCARYLAGQARARLDVLAPEGVTACPMHDPLAVLAVTHPGLLSSRRATVAVDLAAGDGRGTTVARPLIGGRPSRLSVSVASDVDAAAAKAVLIERLCDLP